ncbi:unnamed protein product [Adineta steineri]|uniref:Uncharacterized protein n=1 Tax=Adineta steineri TaxID=433720 RepID=A0A819E7N0_9BILA|nr:unnamed protein product [Adineta steineri]CAF3845957.1 unnamed protein product [Adineta steineri]
MITVSNDIPHRYHHHIAMIAGTFPEDLTAASKVLAFSYYSGFRIRTSNLDNTTFLYTLDFEPGREGVFDKTRCSVILEGVHKSSNFSVTVA